MNTFDFIFVACMLLNAAAMLYLGLRIESLQTEKPKPIIFQDTELYQYNATGFYIPNCGYFVDTRGRGIEAVNRTDNHEICHALTSQTYNKSHWCGV